MPLVDFRKKIRFFSFVFRRNFEVRTFSRWVSIRGTKFFLRDIQKLFFLQNVHLGPIRWIPKLFFKIWIFIVEICILSWDFWVIFEKLAHAEHTRKWFLSHTEHTRNWFHRTLSIRRLNFYVCSASGKILTVFICTAMLSIQGNAFIAPCAYEEMI
jgi:hypothetical protein